MATKKATARNGKPRTPKSKLAEANNLKPKMTSVDEVKAATKKAEASLKKHAKNPNVPTPDEVEEVIQDLNKPEQKVIVECEACGQKNRVIVGKPGPTCGKCGETIEDDQIQDELQYAMMTRTKTPKTRTTSNVPSL